MEMVTFEMGLEGELTGLAGVVLGKSQAFLGSGNKGAHAWNCE